VTLPPDLMARVRQIQIRTHRLVNTALSGGYRSTFRGQGIEFSEVRAYQPGDEVRRIDWNVTARTGDAYIKTYAEERELTIQFIVDTSLSMDFGSRLRTKRETAAQFCALMSLVALRHQDRVGLTLFGARPGLHLPARKGATHVLRVVREVIAARSTGRGSSLARVLEHQLRHLKRRSLVLVVSDFLGVESEGWSEVLARLGRRHDVLCVRVFDPLEEELPEAGWLLFEEIESGERVEVDTRSHRVRAAWAERARRRREALRGLVRRAGVPSIDVSTAGDVADPLVRHFDRRARPGRRGGVR
jgi:uncharacterized protein (DUF58 family)